MAEDLRLYDANGLSFETAVVQNAHIPLVTQNENLKMSVSGIKEYVDSKPRSAKVFALSDSLDNLGGFVTGDLLINVSRNDITVPSYPGTKTLKPGDIAEASISQQSKVDIVGNIIPEQSEAAARKPLVFPITANLTAQDINDGGAWGTSKTYMVGDLALNAGTADITVPKYPGTLTLKPGEVAMLESIAYGFGDVLYKLTLDSGSGGSSGVMLTNDILAAVSPIHFPFPLDSLSREFGSHGTGTSKWLGGVLAPNGRIYGIPYDSATVLEIDPASGTSREFGSHGTGTAKWLGGVLAPNGRIYGIPYGSATVLEIDPASGTSREFGSHTGTSKWLGGVLAPNGKIYGIPYYSATVLEIENINNDPNFNLQRLINMNQSFNGANL